MFIDSTGKLMQALSVFTLLLDAVFSLMLAAAIDAILSLENSNVYLLLSAALFTCRATSEAVYHKLFAKETMGKGQEILRSYFDAPIPKQDTARITQIFDRDLEYCITFETRSYPVMFASIPLALVLYGFVLFNNAILAGIILLLAAMETVLPVLFNKTFSRNYVRTSQIEEEIEGFYFTIFSNIKKCWFLPSGYLTGRLRSWNQLYYKAGVNSEKAAALYNNLLQIVSIASQFGLYFVGAFLISGFQYSFAEIVSLIYLGTKIMSIISEEASLLKARSEYMAAKARIEEIHMNAQRKVKAIHSFHRISYKRFQSPYLNQEVSFTILPGDVWIIKGKNGSGKSTLVRALMNTLDEFTGELTIDGEDVHKIDMRELIYYVPQDAVNLRLTPKQLFQSCSCNSNHRVFQDFPFDPSLMDKPIHAMSGGEQKSVHIMCAFASGKPVLVFDEPETSLDTQNRELLYNAISVCNRTIILITNGSDFDAIPHHEVHL